VACARANGVDAHQGDLLDGVPGRVLAELPGRVDLVVGVVPYVPTGALGLLQRDTLTFEASTSYDGGPDGTEVLRRVLREAAPLLRPRGTLALEVGGDQVALLAPDLAELGYRVMSVLVDDEQDERAIVAVLG
jgi:release factor glutamine methyltransferase